MSYICKVEAKNDWQKLEDLIKALTGFSTFAFDSDTTYQIQAEGMPLHLCEQASKPTDKMDGFVIAETQVANYKPNDSYDLYVRSDVNNVNHCAIKIGTLGE